MSRDARYYRRTSCRLCGSSEITLAISLKPSPLAELYLPPEEAWKADEKYPLDVFLCNSCGHVQLVDIVDPKFLFSDYPYETKTSPGLVEYFSRYASHVVSRFTIKPRTRVLDIGSNDGTLLSHFARLGMEIQGVDPATQIANNATANGIPSLNAFMNTATAEQLLCSGTRFGLVTANNVFAHNDKLGEMVDAVRLVLDDDGLFIFEASYLLDTITNLVFDFIYHEHLCYHSVRALKTFFERRGLELIAVERTASKGGTLRGFAQKTGAGRSPDGSVNQLVTQELEARLGELETYAGFMDRVNSLGADLARLLAELKSSGSTVWGYGASATSTTLLHHFDVGRYLDRLVDDNQYRQGLVSPGYRIPIGSPAELTTKRPNCVIILAWRFADQIISRNHAYLSDGGTFVIPCPLLKVVTN